MSRRKKVKFADSASLHGASFKEKSSLQAERTLTSEYEEPKTSEYRVLKKLREESGSKLHCHPPKQGMSLKTSESGYSMTERRSSIRGNCKMGTSLWPILKVPPIAQSSSSPAMVSHNCELNKTIECKNGWMKSSSPSQKSTPIVRWSSLLRATVSPDCGPKYEHGGIFTKKRENILKLAADTLSLKMDEFMSSRSDLVSVFLERLGSEVKLSKTDELVESKHESSSGRNQLLASYKSNGYLETSHETASRALSETNPYRCKDVDDFVPSSKDYIEFQAFPTWVGRGTNLQCDRRKHKWLSDVGRISDLPASKESSSAIGWNTDFGFGGYDYHPPGHVKFDSEFSSRFPSRCYITEQAFLPFLETEEEGFVSNDLVSFRYGEADDLISSSMDDAEDFTPRTNIQCKRKFKWALNDGRISEPPVGKKPELAIEWNPVFGSTNYENHTVNFGNSGSNYFTDKSFHPLIKYEKEKPHSNTDGLVGSSMRYAGAEASPTWQVRGLDFEFNKWKTKWMSNGSISDLLDEKKSSSTVEWLMDLTGSRPDDFLTNAFKDRSLVPLLDFGPLENYALRLLGGDENFGQELKLCVASDQAKGYWYVDGQERIG